MKVLHVGTHFSLYVTTLMAGFINERSIAFLPRKNFESEVGSPGGASLVLFRGGGLRNLFSFAAAIMRFRRLLSKFRPDIVHFQETPTPLFRALWNSAKAYPRVLTIHDVLPHPGQQKNLHRRRYYIGEARRDANRVIVHGRYQANLLGPERHQGVRVIPHPTLPLDLRGPRLVEGRYALMVGRMEAYKGLAILRRALESIQSTGRTVRMVVAGDGAALSSERGALQRISDVTIIQRYLAPEELGALLRDASFLVTPYTEASASGIISMAQTVSLPVVSSDAGTLREYVADGVTGWVVPAGDVDQLAAALIDADGCPRRLSGMSERIAEAVEAKFSTRAVAAATREVYEEVVADQQWMPRQNV